MTKTNITTRRTKPAEEEKRVEVASAEPEVKESPRVKRLLEVEEKAETVATPETPPSIRAAVVELVEGSTYEIRGMRFLSHRPVVVTDQRILSAVEVNSRFRVTDAEGGK